MIYWLIAPLSYTWIWGGKGGQLWFAAPNMTHAVNTCTNTPHLEVWCGVRRLCVAWLDPPCYRGSDHFESLNKECCLKASRSVINYQWHKTPPVLLFNLAPHNACHTVAVLLARLAINHREPEGSFLLDHPSVVNYSLCAEHCRINMCEQTGNHNYRLKFTLQGHYWFLLVGVGWGGVLRITSLHSGSTVWALGSY